MTVYDYLKDKDGYIKIGAQKGSNFIFCGTADKFIEIEPEMSAAILHGLIKEKETVIREVEKIDEKYANTFARNIQAFQIDYLRGTKGLKREYRFRKYNSLYEYKEGLEKEKEKEENRLIKRIEFLTHRIEKFTPIRTREVREHYPSQITNRHGVKDEIVLFKGVESGKYWDLDEYENGVEGKI